MAQPSFVIGQYVWAKLTGFPHWPAKILELGKTADSDHYVEFLGPKKTVAEAKVKAIVPDEYDKVVKAGKKAKGPPFMKSVNELRQLLPESLLANLSPGRPLAAAAGGSSALSPSQLKKSTATMAARKTAGGRSGSPNPSQQQQQQQQQQASNGETAAFKSKATTKGTPPAMKVADPTVMNGGDTVPTPGPAKKTHKRATTVDIEKTKTKASPVQVAFDPSTVVAPSPKKRPMDLSDGGSMPAAKLPKTVPADSTSKMNGSMSPRKNYGFIGLGIMGTGMASNLLKNHNVVVWNRSGVTHTDLKARGGKIACSPAEVVERSDIIFACVSTPEAAREILTRKDGVLAGMSRSKGKGYVDMSTVDPTTSRFACEAVHKAGGLFLEAPVSGSKKPAQDGQLVILTAGDQALFDQATPAFSAMGKAHYFLGEVGSAAKMKLVVNMMMGSMTAALCESMALAKDAGLSQMMLHQILSQGALNCKMVEAKGAAILKGEFPPSFPLKHQQKDMRLALALADDLHQPLPVAAAANESFKQAMQMGYGNSDMSSVYMSASKGRATL